MTIKKNSQKSNPFKINSELAKLQQLFQHLKQFSLPVANELQSHTLNIPQTLTEAYLENHLVKKKLKYEDTLKSVRAVQKRILEHLDEEIILPFHSYIIYEDLTSLAYGLEDIINLLNDPSKLLKHS